MIKSKKEVNTLLKKIKVTCPHCGKVAKRYENAEVCLDCGKFYLPQEEVDAEVDRLIGVISESGRYETIKTLLCNGEKFTADDEMTKIFKKDIFWRIAVADRIRSEHQDEMVQNPVANVVSNTRTIPLRPCAACGKQISTQAVACPNCGHPTGVHVCPKCGSTNTKVISGASKATSIFLWGAFAANKVVSQHQCKDCWHKF